MQNFCLEFTATLVRAVSHHVERAQQLHQHITPNASEHRASPHNASERQASPADVIATSVQRVLRRLQRYMAIKQGTTQRVAISVARRHTPPSPRLPARQTFHPPIPPTNQHTYCHTFPARSTTSTARRPLLPRPLNKTPQNPATTTPPATTKQNTTKPGIPPTTPTKPDPHRIQRVAANKSNPSKIPTHNKIYMATTIGNQAIVMDGHQNEHILDGEQKSGPEAKGK